MGSALETFNAVSGASADQLSMIIRSILCALFLLWVAYSIYSQYRLVKVGELDISEMPLLILRRLLLCTVLIILITVK
jgi:integrating conjugative element protein (TIGR03758 family)